MKELLGPSGNIEYLLSETDIYNTVLDFLNQSEFIKPILINTIKENLEDKLRSINIEAKDSDYILDEEKHVFLPLEITAKTPFQLYYILKYKQLKEIIEYGIGFVTIDAQYLAELSDNADAVKNYAAELVQTFVYKILISEIILFNSAELKMDSLKILMLSKDEAIRELERKLQRNKLSERNRQQHFMIIDYIIDNKAAGISAALKNVKRLPQYEDSDLNKLFHEFRVNYKDEVINYISEKVPPEKVPHLVKMLYGKLRMKSDS